MPPKITKYKGYASTGTWVDRDRLEMVEEDQDPKVLKRLAAQIRKSHRFDPIEVWTSGGNAKLSGFASTIGILRSF